MQENETNVPVENEDISVVPDYMKTCIELSLNMALKEGELRDRCFHLLSGGVVFGICIGELPDSFLVFGSARLISESGKIDGKPFSKKIIRLIRTAVAFISIPDPEHRYYYFRWLKKQFGSSDFFDKDRRDIIEKYVYAYENSKTKVEQSAAPEDDDMPVEGESASPGGPDSFWAPYESTEFH